MKSNIFLLIFIFTLTGCNTLEHLDQLLTLKDYSDEQIRLQKHVAEQDKKFELLLESVKNHKLSGINKKGIIKRFGAPVYIENVKIDNQGGERFVYRYAAQYFDSEKVYLDFDVREQLISTEYIPRKNESLQNPPQNL